MTFAASKVVAGRQPFLACEIDLNRCSNVYADSLLSPAGLCTANGGTGFQCYNTRKTCQDTANYADTTQTYKFCDRVANFPAEQDLIPAIVDWSLSPSRIDPGKGMGTRAAVSITFQDFAFDDRGSAYDPYVDDRAYTDENGDSVLPVDSGTFFGKWIARNKYFNGRELRVKIGYINDPFSWTDFQTQYYVIESISGPDARGRITITAKDQLKLADDKRALCPAPSASDLNGAIDASQTTLTLTDSSGYSSSGAVRIGDEILSYTTNGKDLSPVTNDLTGITRAAWGSTAAAHADADFVQECAVFNGDHLIDVAKTLLEDYAGVSSSCIPYATDWTDEKNNWLSGFNLTAVISEPTGVTKLLAEISEQCRVIFYSDTLNQQIGLKAIAQRRESDTVAFDETYNILPDSLSNKEIEEDRASRVVMLYGVRNQAGKLDEFGNFARSTSDLNLEIEGAAVRNDKRWKLIFSRWYSTSNSAEVATATSRLLNQLEDSPRKFTFKVDMKDSGLEPASIFSLKTRQAQGDNGQPTALSMQVLSAKQDEPGSIMQIEAITTGFEGRPAYIGPDTLTTYSLESGTNKAAYAFIAPDVGKFADGTNAYTFI